MAHLALNRLKIIILILGLTGHICCAEQVSTVTCSSTGTECSAIPFSICATNKCKCKDGYKEGPNGGSTCVKVLGTQCTGSDPCPGATSSVCTGSKCTCSTGYGERDNACKKLLNTVTCQENGNECDTNEHTECDKVKGKCKCAAGFTMNVDVCMAKNTAKVTDTDCTKGTADQCTGIEHAECNNAATSAKCKCSNGYAADRKTGTSCVKTVSGTTCAAGGKECDGIKNSHCVSTKCQCDDGFAMNVDVCAAESSAISLHFGSLTLFFLVSTMVRHLFW